MTGVGETGRNDPCPCGSGAKYKKCCLPRQQDERQDERAQARMADAADVTVFHGTSEDRLGQIRREGLRPQDGVGPFVTDDKQRAAGYAVRACCVELHARGLTEVRQARRAVVLTLRADRCELVADAAYGGDFLLPGGCSWEQIRGALKFAAKGHVTDAEVEEYAKLGALAHKIEGTWQNTRLARTDAEGAP